MVTDRYGSRGMDTKKLYRLGLMGGTFDPIHYGHLVTAEEARTQFKLDEVIFVPTGKPPHKKNYTVSNTEHRFLMTMLAVMSNPCFSVSRTEIDRKGYSYTIDTILQFRNTYGENTEIFFITGADAILEILTWKNVENLMKECRFIAATRPGFNLYDLKQKFPEIESLYRNSVHFMEVPALSISSTDIRQRIGEARTIKYLLPEAVAHYIYKSHLYEQTLPAY